MASLSPSIKFHALDASGNPAAGWKVWTYEAGTTTPKATYTTSAASVANPNPVVLDSRGEATIWLSGTYKIRLTTGADALVWEDDNVSDGTTNGTFTGATFTGSLTVSSTSVTWSGNPTHSGNHTFSGNVSINGNTTLGNASGDTLTVNPNAVTWTNNPTHSGTNTFANLAITAGAVVAGNYSPTPVNESNTSSLSAEGQWLRIGDVVSVSVSVLYNVTTGSVATSFRIPLPVASNFTQIYQCCGTGVEISSGGGTPTIGVYADTVNNDAKCDFMSGTTGTRRASIHFSYRIV